MAEEESTSPALAELSAHGSTSSPRAEEDETNATVNADAVTLAAELGAERAVLRQAQDEAASLREQIASAAAKYREALLATTPEVPPELVSGATVEEVDASLARARQTVETIKGHLKAQTPAAGYLAGRIPAGAPARGGPDVGALTPAEKIKLALAQEGR